MIGSFLFQICSIFYMSLIILIYFSKPRIKTKENDIYRLLMISDLIILVTDIISVFLIFNMDKYPILNMIFAKLFLLTLIIWELFMTIYVFTISCQNNEKINNNDFKISGIIFIISIILIIILPLYFAKTDTFVYSYGPAAIFTYLITAVLMIVWIIVLLKRFRNIKKKKYTPILIYIVLTIVGAAIQFNYPQILVVSFTSTFVTCLLYFTIENPDIKMIKELNIAREQAEKANNAKTEFLSNMSHEIRTPLNAIVGFSQALSEEDIPPSAKEEVKDIIMASDSLLELVNGILDISKIEAGKLEIVNTEYNFKKIWDELILLTKARMGEKALDFRYIYDESIPNILYGDYARLKQIILNLLTNAVKYTKEGYIEMKVNSFKKDDICRLIISVEDSGIGIKQENISKLFQKFERFDLEKNITIEGTGLGLAITKRLIELMNGQIVVQSIYGKGSKFIISIDQRIVKKEIIEKDVDLKEKSLKNFNGEGIKILVVDDNKINLKVAQRLLQNYNLEVTLCESGFECLEKINNKENYSLILMDDMMPKMNGKETFNKLKEIPNFSTPVIALTANAISGMKEQYLKLGFSDYLAKPIERSELDRVINKFLNK